MSSTRCSIPRGEALSHAPSCAVSGECWGGAAVERGRLCSRALSAWCWCLQAGLRCSSPGWTLVFLPHVPEGFHRATGGPADSDLIEALNVSLVTLTTLGFGDVTPDDPWLRVIVPIEALVGFGLLSASISWLLLIHPALARRRSLAYEISLLRKAEEETGTALAELDAAPVEQIYAELISRLVAVERDLVNFPVTYYFAED